MDSIGKREPPLRSELEVSLFGPGFGECVVAHLGHGDWIVVDSCRNLETKRAVALDYLSAIGVNIADSVKLVVATHWHDDHIDGLSDVFHHSPNAVFACTAAFRLPDFQEVLANFSGMSAMPGGSGINEFESILTEVQRRKYEGVLAGFQPAGANTILWERLPAPPAVVRALSPCVADELAAVIRVRAENLLGRKARRRVPTIEPNDASVVLSLRVEDTLLMLLGADLEETGANRGWQAVVTQWNPAAGLHQYFKIAHHGSSDAHYEPVWTQMLISDPPAALTPFRHMLPTDDDLNRIRSLTSNAVITAPRRVGRFRSKNPATDRIVRGMTRKIWTYPAAFGQVTWRRPIDSTSAWRMQTFGTGVALSH